ncbi:MAG: hypothetical protein FJ096_19265 [Deltaproteobacteria bacterium]|nr:hypothetical protein [Deltaproteobacteria bacterium]
MTHRSRDVHGASPALVRATVAASALVAGALACLGCPEHAPIGPPVDAVATSGSGGAASSGTTTTVTGGAGMGGAGGAASCDAIAWGRVLAVTGERRVARALVTPGGDILLAGDFTGTLSLDGDVDPILLQATGRDAFILRFDACGRLLWKQQSEGSGDEHALDLAVFGDDAVLAVSYTKSLGFGGALTVLQGGAVGGVLRFDATGASLWQNAVGVLGEGGLQVAAAPDVGLYLSGGITGSLGGGQMLAAKGKRDVYLTRLGADGKPLWQRRFGTSSDEYATALSVAPSGIFLGGVYTAALSFGGTPLPDFMGLPLGFLVRAEAGDGAITAAIKHTDNVLTSPSSIAPASDGSVWLASTLVGKVGAELFNDGLVQRFAPGPKGILGELLYGVGDTHGQTARGIVLRPDGHAVVLGTVGGFTSFGGGVELEADKADVLLLELDDEAKVVTAKAAGGPSKEQEGQAIALGAAGELVLAGLIDGALDLPGKILQADGPSLFLARLPSKP